MALAIHLGEVVHHVEHDLFDDGSQAAGAGVPLLGQVGDFAEGVRFEHQLGPFHVEQLLVLADQRVLRLREDSHEGVFVQRIERGDHRQAADELGDQPERHEILGRHLGQQFAERPVAAVFGDAAESDRLAADALLDHVVEADERPADDEEDVGRIELDVLLLGMLTAPLRRHVAHGAFQNLQERLLHAFAGDIARDAHVVARLGDLVDFVDVDDAALGRFDVEVGGVQELEQEVLDVFADVARFGEGRGVADGEGHIQHFGQRAGEQRLAATGRPHEQDIALLNFDVAAVGVDVAQPFVMVVNGDRQHPFGALLADDVLIELFLDTARRRRVGTRRAFAGATPPFAFLLDDRLAKVDALAADVDIARPFDQRSDIAVAPPAEGTKGVPVSTRRAGGFPAPTVARTSLRHCDPDLSL